MSPFASPPARPEHRWGDLHRLHHEQLRTSNSPADPVPELFPLPLIAGAAGMPHTGASRDARRRQHLRQYALDDANETILALNALYGADKAAVSPPSEAQVACQRRLLASSRAARHDFLNISADGAARTLLGDRFDYGGHASSVVGYQEGLVSLPAVNGKPVPLSSVLDLRAQELLDCFPDRILADEEVANYRLRNEHITSYTDAVLRADRSAYLTFVSSLVKRGLIRGCLERRARITPFFVHKKGGKQRLVFYCRRANVFVHQVSGYGNGFVRGLLVHLYP